MNEIILVVYLTFSGYNISVDAEQMYGITKVEECKKHLPKIIKEYKAKDGTCFVGTMREKLGNA